jgi:hypothetical protein
MSIMFDWEKHKVYIIIGILAGIVLLYFLQTWHIKSLIKDELKKLEKGRRKKQMKMIKYESIPEQDIEQAQAQSHAHAQYSQDMDSYIDPGEENGNEDVDRPLKTEKPQYQQKRLSQDDVLIRDMVDGSQDSCMRSNVL